MTDPLERPDPGSINAATREAVQADRARVAAAERAARLRRGSIRGRLERVVRWLRNRQTGPVPRLRRVASVVKATIRARGPWRSLPESLATALLAPVRLPSKPAPPQPPRDWSPNRIAAAARLKQAVRLDPAGPGGNASPGATRRRVVAVIANPPDLEALSATAEMIELRPEDWADVLDAMHDAGNGPDALVVVATEIGFAGAWAYRIAWAAHPDSFLHRDLSVLIGWFQEHDTPSILAITDARPEALATWGDAADLFDLVLAATPEAAAAYTKRPSRRGSEAMILSDPLGLERVLAALRDVR